MARELPDKEIKSIARIQLEMLKEVDRLCRLEDIPYSIDGGTFLGAVRQQGFIPWDPDIDVIMLRGDYERFYRTAINNIDKSRFFLQEERTDENYRWGFTKIRRKGTSFVREGQEHLKMRTGIFIDILIMDNVPDCIVIRKLFLLFCCYCRFVMWSEVGKKTEKKAFKRFLYKCANHIPASFVFKQLRAVRGMCNSADTELVRYMTCRYTYNKKLCGIERRFFDFFAEYRFEGAKFKGFAEYDAYLTQLYGDYMQLPPEEKRKSHMPVSLLEINIED